MSDAPELLPCPFCGRGDVATEVDHEQGNKWGYATCNQCAARAPEVRTGYETGPDAAWRAKAIAAWNTRADLAAAQVAEAVAAERERCAPNMVGLQSVRDALFAWLNVARDGRAIDPSITGLGEMIRVLDAAIRAGKGEG